MADVNRGNRPLSPHLTIYRPQMTSISSIFVRITGNALLAATLLLIAWLLAASTSAVAFDWVQCVITSWFGDLVFLLSLWALWYHMLGGLRHLIWDTGRGLELKAAERMGWMMIIGSLLLTALRGPGTQLWRHGADCPRCRVCLTGHIRADKAVLPHISALHIAKAQPALPRAGENLPGIGPVLAWFMQHTSRPRLHPPFDHHFFD